MTVGARLGVRPLEVLPGRWVDVIAYVVTGDADGPLVVSDEHTALAFLSVDAVPDKELPEPYRSLIALV